MAKNRPSAQKRRKIKKLSSNDSPVMYTTMIMNSIRSFMLALWAEILRCFCSARDMWAPGAWSRAPGQGAEKDRVKPNSLLVANFPLNWTKEKLSEFFGNFGKIRILRHVCENPDSKPVCIVSYEDEKLTKRVLSAVHNKLVDGKRFDVQIIEDDKIEETLRHLTIPSRIFIAKDFYSSMPDLYKDHSKDFQIVYTDFTGGQPNTIMLLEFKDRGDKGIDPNDVDDVYKKKVYFHAKRMNDSPLFPVCKICTFFADGRCGKLYRCSFMHYFREDICKNFLTLGCFDEDCDLVHIDFESRVFVREGKTLRPERRGDLEKSLQLSKRKISKKNERILRDLQILDLKSKNENSSWAFLLDRFKNPN